MIGNLFSWTVTALFGVITLLLAFESWALLTDHTPITDYIRPAVHTYPGYAFVIAVALVTFLLMLEESIALTTGRDPITNDVRSAVRRFPRVTYAMAVVIGLILGHLLWP